LFNNDGGRFAINANSGIVTVAGAIDREADGASRNITVRATSSDGSYTDQVFAIAITDADEFDVTNPTDADATGNAVDENVSIGAVVGITVTASDSDATNNAVTYSLFDDDGGNFAIDAYTGVVTTAAALNRETLGASHNITVRATSFDGSTADTLFSININDLDEFDTGAVSDTNASANIVDENAAIGSLVGITASSSDADATTNALTYSLVDNDGGRFAIDSNTGLVTVAGAIDREVDGAMRSMTVRATSADGSTADRVFSVNVIDVDEFDVTVPTDSNPLVNAVNENSSIGTVGGLQAVASDSDATNASITYSLDDNAGGRFQIDANTGIVTTVGGLNYESSNSHSITVRATSADGSFKTANFVIMVNDVNERPVASADAYSTTYADVLYVAASGLISNDTDPDGNVLTATLVSGPNSGTLTLMHDGSFTYTPVVPFIGAATFQYTVTDGSLTSDVQTVTINVSLPGGGGSGGSGGNGGDGSASGGGGGSGDTGPKVEQSPTVPPVGPHMPTPTAVRPFIEIANNANSQDTVAGSARSTVSALKADSQHFAFLNFSDSNSILCSLILVSDSQSAVARLSAEQDSRLVKELTHTVDVFARLADDMESRAEAVTMQGVELIAKTAIGSGMLVWVMHVSQVVAALLAASSAWMHIDPLSILNASKEILPDKSSDIAETLFDKKH
jgi:hypothetical protein